MKKTSYSLPIIGCLLLFIALSFFYFTPLLSGNYISQPDIIHYKGGANELEEYRNAYGKDTYWSNSMFGGMPTYQMGANYPYDIIKNVDRILRYFPTPASYLFLLLSGFFLLGMVWLKNWKYALLGSIMFAFSTYFFIIIAAGHNAKVHTIAYFAPFIAGVYLLYQKKYVWGFILSTFFLSLQVAANHPQMTYYLFLALGIFGIVELYNALKTKNIKPFLISTGLFILSIVLALGINSTRLLTTYEYSKETTRGKSELTISNSKENQSNKEGLDHFYITHWSYGILETANLFIPNFMGGGNNEKGFKTDNLRLAINNNIKSEKEYVKFEQAFNGSYWGEQPGTSGPAYQGAVVVFLSILALFFYKGRYKWWLVIATFMSFMLAWGKHLGAFTEFMIDYFPLYNKFRAVSSALVVAEFTLPLLAVLGVYAYLTNNSIKQEYKKKVLVIVSGVILSVLLILYFLGLNILDFHTKLEGENISRAVLEGLRKDRFNLFQTDVLRTFIFVGLTATLLFISLKNKIISQYVVFGIALLSLIDLWGVDKRYLNDDNFVSKQYYKNPYPTEVSNDQIEKAQDNPTLARIVNVYPVNQVLNDIKEHDPAHYRVLNLALSTFNETNTSYFHQSIGGYHGAKLRRYQDIIDFYLSHDNLNLPILEMLNTKYIIAMDSTIHVQPIPTNNGNAWFVKDIVYAKNADEEITKLGEINNKSQAIISSKDQKNLNISVAKDTLGSIELVKYEPNKLIYTSNSFSEKLAVFSEIYYPYGWKATIDGKETNIYKANYVLRAVKIPEGKHTIQFTFDPPVIKKGIAITLASFGIFIVLSIVLIFIKYKSKLNKE